MKNSKQMLELARKQAEKLGTRETCGRLGFMLTLDELKKIYIGEGFTTTPARGQPAYIRHLADWEITDAITRLNDDLIIFEV